MYNISDKIKKQRIFWNELQGMWLPEAVGPCRPPLTSCVGNSASGTSFWSQSSLLLFFSSGQLTGSLCTVRTCVLPTNQREAMLRHLWKQLVNDYWLASMLGYCAVPFRNTLSPWSHRSPLIEHFDRSLCTHMLIIHRWTLWTLTVSWSQLIMMDSEASGIVHCKFNISTLARWSSLLPWFSSSLSSSEFSVWLHCFLFPAAEEVNLKTFFLFKYGLGTRRVILAENSTDMLLK